jgi:hypothetical protein
MIINRKAIYMRNFLLALFLTGYCSLFAQTTTTPSTTTSSTAIIDTARLTVIRDSLRKRINQVFDVDMIMKCFQVKQISALSGFTLLKKNHPLADTIDLFKTGYETNILVHSYINSTEFWPRLLFNPDKMTSLMADPANKPAAGFAISFTPGYLNKNRVFDVAIKSSVTQGLLDTSKLATIQQAANNGLKSHFSSIPKDTVNAAMFSAIATLRDMFDAQTDLCNIAQVTFEPTSGQLYGFDVMPNAAVKSNYEELSVKGHPYEVPWKSVGVGSMDSVRVKVVLRDKNAPTHEIKFRFSNPLTTISPKNDGTYLISFTAGTDKNEQTAEAYYQDTALNGKVKEYVVGKLKIRSYTPIQKTLVPIELNSPSQTTPTDLQSVMNSIYKQAAVTWTVKPAVKITVNKNVWDNDTEDGVLLIESSPLHRYSSEMQAIIDAIPNYDSETYYVIITDLPNNLGYAGYMPLKSQCAFLFNGNEASHTVSHELGHGAFYMKHISDEYKINDASDNLMNSVASGKALWKPQWDWIGDPSWRLYMFQKEEEGAIIANTYYWTPAGTPIHFNSNAITILDPEKINKKEQINGILYSWEENEVKYVASIDPDKNLFYGYVKEGTNEKYSDVTKLAKDQKITVNSIMYMGNCEKEDILTKYTVPEAIDGALSYENGKPLISNFTYTQGEVANLKQFDCTDFHYNEEIFNNNYNELKNKLSDVKDEEVLKDLCKNIATVDPSIIKAYNNWVEEKTNPNNDFFIWYTPGDNKLTKNDLNALKETIIKFKHAYQTFVDANFADGASIVKHVNENFTSKGSMFNFAIVHPFQNVTLANREKLLRLLAAPTKLKQRSNVADSYEGLDVIQELLVNTTKDDAWACIKNLNSNNQLFHILEQATDLLYFGNGLFSSFSELIGKLAVENDNIASDGTKVGEVLFSKNKGLFFDDSYLGNRNKESYNTKSTEIEFTIKNSIVEELVNTPSISVSGAAVKTLVSWLFTPGYKNKWEGKVSGNPLEHIAIIPVKNFKYGGQDFVQGQVYVLPAVTIYGIFKEDTKTAIGTSSKIVINLGLTAVGVGALNAAFETGSAITLLAEGTDITLGIGSSIINSIPEVAEDHPDFVKYYNYATIAYGIARLGYAGYKTVKPLIAKKGAGNWLLWTQYSKKVINGEEFAIVGNRYFSKNAVESMVPNGLGGSGISPSVIDEVISNGDNVIINSQKRFDKGNIFVWTENNGSIVRNIRVNKVNSISDLVSNPHNIFGYLDNELDDLLVQNGWTKGTYSGTSDAVMYFKQTNGGRSEIVFNYGGGLHSGGQTFKKPYYYKLEGPEFGRRIRVIDKQTYPAPEFQNAIQNETFKLVDGPTGTIWKQ